MFLVDANVLIYAFRRDSPLHVPCYRWLRGALAGSEPVATTPLVELALVRITTLPSLRQAAARPEDAFAFLAALRDQPSAIRISPSFEHDDIFARLCLELKLRGGEVNDAYLAALALDHEATLVTVDRGFKRFPDLRLHDPTEAG